MAKPLFPGEKVVAKSTGLRSYLNPKAFDPTPKKEKSRIKISPLVVYLVSSLAALAGILWLILGSSVFRIRDITIEGEAGEETRQMVDTLIGKNIFLIGGSKAERQIVAASPGIKSIKIIRGLPRTLVVKLIERDTALVWETQGKKYLLDKDGVPFKEGDNDRFPKVSDGKNLPIEFGRPIASSTFIVYIKKISLDLPEVTKLEIENISVPESTFQIDVNTKNGYQLKFDTSRPLQDQLEDVEYILDHHQDQAKELIDVRVEGYGYIK